MKTYLAIPIVVGFIVWAVGIENRVNSLTRSLEMQTTAVREYISLSKVLVENAKILSGLGGALANTSMTHAGIIAKFSDQISELRECAELSLKADEANDRIIDMQSERLNRVHRDSLALRLELIKLGGTPPRLEPVNEINHPALPLEVDH